MKPFHYFTAALIILGYEYDIRVCYNFAAGMMIGCGVVCLKESENE